jgi:ABC-type ATPase involved in cell division
VIATHALSLIEQAKPRVVTLERGELAS